MSMRMLQAAGVLLLLIIFHLGPIYALETVKEDIATDTKIDKEPLDSAARSKRHSLDTSLSHEEEEDKQSPEEASYERRLISALEADKRPNSFLEDDKKRSMGVKRLNFDLGKRLNFDLGKRYNWDLGKRYNWDLGKRYNWDLGKRYNWDLGKRYNWDLGKRYNWDLGKRNNGELGKRYSNFDLGKRYSNFDLGKRYSNFDLGKRYNWDLGKRYNFDLGKRASDKRYNFDLGKRQLKRSTGDSKAATSD